jgi:hypothetical protein
MGLVNRDKLEKPNIEISHYLGVVMADTNLTKELIQEYFEYRDGKLFWKKMLSSYVKKKQKTLHLIPVRLSFSSFKLRDQIF